MGGLDWLQDMHGDIGEVEPRPYLRESSGRGKRTASPFTGEDPRERGTFVLGGRTFYGLQGMRTHFRRLMHQTECAPGRGATASSLAGAINLTFVSVGWYAKHMVCTWARITPHPVRTGRCLMARHFVCRQLDRDQMDEVLDLVRQGHKDAPAKIGAGVDQVRVGRHPLHGSRCFLLWRKDGTVVDVSANKCINNLVVGRWEHPNQKEIDEHAAARGCASLLARACVQCGLGVARAVCCVRQGADVGTVGAGKHSRHLTGRSRAQGGARVPGRTATLRSKCEPHAGARLLCELLFGRPHEGHRATRSAM